MVGEGWPGPSPQQLPQPHVLPWPFLPPSSLAAPVLELPPQKSLPEVSTFSPEGSQGAALRSLCQRLCTCLTPHWSEDTRLS